MKMKTKFFGISAKLALAIMAVSGALFTSCYDSVDGDVTPPPVLPDPVYSISGVVTNLATGLPVQGVTLTFTPASGTAFTAATSNGAYNASTKVAGAYTVAVDATTAANFDIKYGASFSITALDKGMAGSYMQNVALEPKDYKGYNGMKINFASEAAGVYSKTFDGATESKVDIVNDGNSFLYPYFTMVVDTAARFVSTSAGLDIQPAAATPKAAPASLNDYLKRELTAIYGKLPVNQADAFATGKVTYKFEVAPLSSVKTISATTKYKQDTYTFTYDGVAYTIVIKAVSAYEFANTQYSNDIYHGHGGHGHGHGHGGDLNAGGGIVSGEM